MTRRSEREAREARAVEEVLDGVLANWGIDMDVEDPDLLGSAFARQIGEGEAVEYHEVYSLLRDIALESHKLGRTTAGTAAAEEELAKAEAEVHRLREIIKRAYGTQGWDIGSMKNLLIAGLEGYENLGWARLHEPVGIPTGQPYRTDHWGIGFSDGSSRDAWWVEVSLMDEDNDEHAVLTLTDKDALELSALLDERVRQGRRDWS